MTKRSLPTAFSDKMEHESRRRNAIDQVFFDGKQNKMADKPAWKPAGFGQIEKYWTDVWIVPNHEISHNWITNGHDMVITRVVALLTLLISRLTYFDKRVESWESFASASQHKHVCHKSDNSKLSDATIWKWNSKALTAIKGPWKLMKREVSTSRLRSIKKTVCKARSSVVSSDVLDAWYSVSVL